MTFNDTVVDRYWTEFSEVSEMLRMTGDLSLYSTITDTFRKILLLAAASHFETEMQRALEVFISEATEGNALITSLVKEKAIKRQYHTWFDWDGANVNKFLSLFGKSFRVFMTAQIANGKPREESVRAFLEIGANRNRLVHNNFGEFQMEKTMSEIYGLYKDAREFVGSFPSSFYEFSETEHT